MSESPRPDAVGAGDPSVPPFAGAADAWAGWPARLVERVRGLPDGAALTLTATQGDARTVLVRKARLRGFIPARRDVVVPWVRLRRVEDHLSGRCVGSASFGGPFTFSPDEDAALLAIGWHRPGAGDGHDLVRFWPDDVAQGPFLPRDEAERAVAMVVATFREVLCVGGDPPNVSG